MESEMLKLYFFPGASSLSTLIALHEAGLAHEAILANIRTGKLADGSDYRAINPLGYVPYLVLDNGDALHECSAILLYAADQAPEKHLAPPAGDMQRYHLIEWLNFIATELHKGFGALFLPDTPDAVRAQTIERLSQRYAYINRFLEGKSWLIGEHFSVADIYLFVTCRWCQFLGIDLSAHPNITACMERVAARPAVKAALDVEAAARL